MYTDSLVFSQVMEHLPMHTFRRCVQRYRGNHRIKSFSCVDQYRCMTFAQLTYRESLRDIEVCLRAQQSKLPTHQIVFRHFRECREDADLDRHFSLCAGGDH